MITGLDPQACKAPFCCNGQCYMCHGTGIMHADPALGFDDTTLERYNLTMTEYIESCKGPCIICNPKPNDD